MTTLAAPTMQNDVRSLHERLDAVGNRFRMLFLLRAAARLATIALPLLAASLFVAGYFALPGWANLAIVVGNVGLWVLLYVRLLHRPIFHRPTYGEVARLIEENAAGKLPLNNELINGVLLAQEFETVAGDDPTTAPPKARMIPSVLHEIAGRTASVDLAASVPWAQAQRAGLWALAAIAFCLLWVGLFSGTFAHGLAVLSGPTKFVPKTGLVKIVSVEPGNDSILAGQPINFVVNVEAPDNKLIDTKLSLAFASGKTAVYPMTVFGSENTQYRYQLANVAEDVEYVITAGDTQSEKFKVSVMPQIKLVALKVETTPPGYTGLDKTVLALTGKDASAARGSVEVAQGSQLAIMLAIDMPVKEALIEVQPDKAEGQLPPPMLMTASSDRKTFTVTLPVHENFKYALRVNDGQNRTLQRWPHDETNASANSLQFYSVMSKADNAPTMTVTEPARDVDAKPGDKLALMAQATDDYAVTSIGLEIAKNNDEKWQRVMTWPMKYAEGPNPIRQKSPPPVKHMLDMPATEYRYGDTLRYRFVATDNRALTHIDSRLGAQSTASQVFTVSFNDKSAIAAKTSKLWDELRNKLHPILEKQIALREATKPLAPAMGLSQAQKATAPIGEGQKGVRAEMALLAKDFPFEPGMKLIQKSLQVLVAGDATEAVDRAGDILLLTDVKTLGPIATKLRQHQSRIIDVLQSLLAISTSEQNKPSSVVSKDGGDVPTSAEDAWKKLADELKEFQKEQKAVIDATADLAKKPKDQFDQKDEQKLKDLAAVQDKWEKFLSQRLVDMSKVAEQDQANVSLLEELVQMKVELAMSKNALNEKQLEIATALEDNGLENAKELTTHIERWLQHKPDRQQWQMEEMVGQNDPKMAELPKQLQDMVGDLMDKEEDVTEAMEDMGSKWADSLDKGAGWDAMDGPISNMSAQGVTGNQLPNDNEIQGRSGEGREGRASGEMVGAEAEGKGGRRTPTRMTPEPFSQGQVEDKSKAPAGGATGGGKKGGFGGEGLEGPAPEQMKDDLKRMQGTQAAIRNEAERIQLQMRAAGFENFKLFEAAVLMKKSEDALKKYHYNTALYYQKQAVQSLNTAKVLAAGQMHVQSDSTPTVNAKTQKEINDAMNGVMPKGFADPVKAYFQKLSSEPGQ